MTKMVTSREWPTKRLRSNTVAVDKMQQRIEALENRVVDLEAQLYQRAKDAAYVFIHSNWHLIRWYLNRQRDINGDGSDI